MEISVITCNEIFFGNILERYWNYGFDVIVEDKYISNNEDIYIEETSSTNKCITGSSRISNTL